MFGVDCRECWVWRALVGGGIVVARVRLVGGIRFAAYESLRVLARTWADGLKERQLEEDVSALFCDNTATHGVRVLVLVLL